MFEALNTSTNVRYALKMIECCSEMEYEEVLEDVRSFCEVAHPFLVNSYGSVAKEFRVENGTPSTRIWIVYLLMEAKKRSLDLAISENLSLKLQRFPENEMQKLVFSVLIGMAVIQKAGKTAHGTINPGNIILAKDGVYKLSNVGTFSFQRMLKKYEKERLTPNIKYWSPEAIQAVRQQTALQYDFYRSDAFSLGMVLLQAAVATELPRLNEPTVDATDEIQRYSREAEMKYGTSFGALIRSMVVVSQLGRPDFHQLCQSKDFLTFTGTQLKDIEYFINMPILHEITYFTADSVMRKSQKIPMLAPAPNTDVVTLPFDFKYGTPPRRGAAAILPVNTTTSIIADYSQVTSRQPRTITPPPRPIPMESLQMNRLNDRSRLCDACDGTGLKKSMIAYSPDRKDYSRPGSYLDQNSRADEPPIGRLRNAPDPAAFRIHDPDYVNDLRSGARSLNLSRVPTLPPRDVNPPYLSSGIEPAKRSLNYSAATGYTAPRSLATGRTAVYDSDARLPNEYNPQEHLRPHISYRDDVRGSTYIRQSLLNDRYTHLD
jgi:hypothetical protein